MFRHILVATDGSARSTRAVELALKIARASRARLTAFHSLAPFKPPVYMDIAVPYPELFSDQAYKKAAEARAKRLLDRVSKRAARARVRCETAFGYADSPGRGVLAEARARRCDLIIMASHSRGRLERLLVGSETTRVLTHTRIPVLVTH